MTEDSALWNSSNPRSNGGVSNIDKGDTAKESSTRGLGRALGFKLRSVPYTQNTVNEASQSCTVQACPLLDRSPLKSYERLS
ncbi:hypothetical protein H8959_019483 [Pygathrix nigripes]